MLYYPHSLEIKWKQAEINTETRPCVCVYMVCRHVFVCMPHIISAEEENGIIWIQSTEDISEKK